MIPTAGDRKVLETGQDHNIRSAGAGASASSRTDIDDALTPDE